MPVSFWDQVDKLKEAAVGSPPTGDFFTTVQWAERYGIPLPTARSQLAKLVKDGVLSVKAWGGWNYYSPRQETPAKRKKT